MFHFHQNLGCYITIGSHEIMLCVYSFTCSLGVWGLNYVAFSLKHEYSVVCINIW